MTQKFLVHLLKLLWLNDVIKFFKFPNPTLNIHTLLLPIHSFIHQICNLCPVSKLCEIALIHLHNLNSLFIHKDKLQIYSNLICSLFCTKFLLTISLSIGSAPALPLHSIECELEQYFSLHYHLHYNHKSTLSLNCIFLFIWFLHFKLKWLFLLGLEKRVTVWMSIQEKNTNFECLPLKKPHVHYCHWNQKD